MLAIVLFDGDGLLTGKGNWIVKDDPGDYRHDTRFDWVWNRIRTDGGVFRGGLTNQSVTIDPAFNDAASRSPSITANSPTGRY